MKTMAQTSSPLVLIIDDEPDILELLDLTLQRMQVQTCSASTMAEAMALLAEKHFDLCLTDMRLPDGDGLAVVRHIQQNLPQTPVAMITAYGSLDTAISALKAGAFDFLTKPVDLQRLRELVNSALRLKPEQAAEPGDQARDPILGISPAIEQLRSRIAKLARSQAPLYISGESGSGKELVARRIHTLSSRAQAPFVPVNCGAIPSELMESEFFGHRKGSFTGAVADKPGLFQAATGGTLFLDEVADLPMSMQVKLLRAIQEKAVRPVGTQQEEAVDVRLLCATHKDLAAEVSEGRFRQDLFYRINVIELSVPPLRERREDIPLLTAHILARLAARNQMPVPHIGKETMERLASYRFPGNVRELENILERAFTLSEGQVIETDDIHISACPTTASAQPPSLGDIGSLEDYLDNIERSAITQALEETRWNKTAAAKRLGLTFRSLRYRLKKLGLED
jgi:two-component system response regulator PilR (NtrC family)|tara:strand:+ start:4968 stop:6332 length:1365 start_codon:yes stop_codon:yes gene_type:complete